MRKRINNSKTKRILLRIFRAVIVLINRAVPFKIACQANIMLLYLLVSHIIFTFFTFWLLGPFCRAWSADHFPAELCKEIGFLPLQLPRTSLVFFWAWKLIPHLMVTNNNSAGKWSHDSAQCHLSSIHCTVDTNHASITPATCTVNTGHHTHGTCKLLSE